MSEQSDRQGLRAEQGWLPEYLGKWAGPHQCENRNLAGTARCTNAAEYVISVRDVQGRICGECVGGCVRANAKNAPVVVEKLP